MHRFISISLSLFFSLQLFSQDKRVQYPGILSNSYFAVNIGSINYPFTNEQLENGFTAESIEVPHTAVRLVLFGHQFNKNVSAQITYMRPVLWVHYKNVNGLHNRSAVFMNVAGLTVKENIPLSKEFSLYGEGGLGIVTRSGFDLNGIPAVKDANYSTVLLGGGLQYHLNKKFDLDLSTAYSPKNFSQKQPHTIFFGAGFNYYLRPLPQNVLNEKLKGSYFFPKNILSIAYTTNGFGYNVNNFVSERKIPIFWGGNAQVKNGFSIHYLHSIFRSRKVFSLEWGGSFGYWVSRYKSDKFVTLSLFPLVRFTAVRTKPFDAYLFYSVAGPTYISKTLIDDWDTGKNFTFQDLMGIGAFVGKKRKFNPEIRIGHFSNGNLFPRNEGVKVPLTFSLGYTFDKL